MNTSKKWAICLLIIAISLLAVGCDIITDLGQGTGEKAMVEGVEIEVAESDPPEYYAVASGLLPDGCTEIGDSEQEVNGRTIEVTLYTNRTEEGTCPDLASVPFEETISLDVEGLSAGSYAVDVNGVVASLTLTVDHQGSVVSGALAVGQRSWMDDPGGPAVVWKTQQLGDGELPCWE